MAEDDAKIEARNEWHELQARLGKQLREVYADIEAEPIPERFARLLEPPPDRPRPAGAARQVRLDIEFCNLRAKPLLRA
jgi:hypothetical protein